MLIQFNFKNFNSFRDEATLDLSAAKMTEFSERVISFGGEKVLPVAAVYGANASGKSNVYAAFEYMTDYVVDSFKYGDEVKNFDEIRPHPFLFDKESAQADTSFEVYFTVPGDKTEKSYNYGFCVGHEGITEEWLNYKAKTARKYKSIFYRDKNTLDLSGIPKASRENISVALEKQVLIVSLGAKLRIAKCKLVRDWFLNNEFADFGNVITNFFMSRVLPEGFVDDEKVREKVVSFFASFDETIKGYGHEDTVFGIQLQRLGVEVKHIDNPVVHVGIEDNATFLLKTQKALGNLYALYAPGNYPELLEVSKILSLYRQIEKLHGVKFVAGIGRFVEKAMRRNLLSSAPSLRVFDLYKLLYLCRLSREK